MGGSIHDLGDFVGLWKAIWELNSEPWESDLYQQLVGAYAPVGNREALEHLLPSSERPSSDTGSLFIYLPEVRTGVVQQPVVRLRCAFDQGEPPWPEVRIQVALFRIADSVLRATGLRFEHPDGPGTHGFSHMQFIHTFYPNGRSINGCDSTIPVEQPSVPLPAGDAVELTVCALLALYGMEQLTRFGLHLTTPAIGNRMSRLLSSLDISLRLAKGT